MVGSEGIHAHVRFSFGVPDLYAGIALIPAMVGALQTTEHLTGGRAGARPTDHGCAARACPPAMGAGCAT